MWKSKWEKKCTRPTKKGRWLLVWGMPLSCRSLLPPFLLWAGVLYFCVDVEKVEANQAESWDFFCVWFPLRIQWETWLREFVDEFFKWISTDEDCCIFIYFLEARERIIMLVLKDFYACRIRRLVNVFTKCKCFYNKNSYHLQLFPFVFFSTNKNMESTRLNSKTVVHIYDYYVGSENWVWMVHFRLYFWCRSVTALYRGYVCVFFFCATLCCIVFLLYFILVYCLAVWSVYTFLGVITRWWRRMGGGPEIGNG